MRGPYLCDAQIKCRSAPENSCKCPPAANVWALKCSIYTLGLETAEVAEATAEDTGSDKVALSSDKMAIKC